MDQHAIAIIAEDDAVGDSLRMLLDSQGYAVERFPLAGSSLDLLGSQSFACLLVGQFGRSLPGLRLLAELRRRGDSTPAVLVTNAMGEQDCRLADCLGGILVLEKPFDPAELLAFVGRHQRARNAA